MKKYSLFFILLFSLFKIEGQNVLRSAHLIEKYIDNTEEFDTVYKELAIYVKQLNNIKLSSVGDSLIKELKSKYLQDYFKQLNKTKSLALDNATKNATVAHTAAFLSSLDSIIARTGISSLVTTFRSSNNITLSEALNYFNVPKNDSILGLLKLNKDTLVNNIIKQFKDKAVRDNPQITASITNNIKKSADNITKKISVQGKTELLTNLNFEITNAANAAKNAVKLPSENDVIDAMAIFIAGRIKEETVMAFIEQVNKNLDRIDPLPCLFKNTIKELGDYSPGNPVRFGAIVKKAIANDIARLPDNIIECSSCGNNEDIKKNTHFTNFFNDLSDGVDLITNIEYYSEQVKDTSTKFVSALKVFRFVNRYFSHLEDKNSESTWVGPDIFDETKDPGLKLGLSLIYEKEPAIFKAFLMDRYNVSDLDAFFADTAKFNLFKKNFRELLFKLHWLDSYWQSNKQDGRAIVNVKLYTEKVTEVFKTLYSILTYTSPGCFPTENEKFQNYLAAKEAVVKKDIEGVVYESQKLIDLLNCYKINIPHLKLPEIDFNWRKSDCIDTSMVGTSEMNRLKEVSKVSVSDLSKIHQTLRSDLSMATVTQALFCRHLKKHKIPNCNIINGGFKKHKSLFDKYYNCGSYRDAMNLKFNPWSICRLPMFIFDFKDWKVALKMWHIRAKYNRHAASKNNENYMCYLSQESVRNKLSFNGARRDVSQVLNILTDITKAKGSSELSKVIEEYAEPPQSYKIKRFNNFSIDLNSYPGVYLAAETKASYNIITKTSKDNLTKAVWGVTAPIGLSFSWAGRIRFKCSNGSKYPAFITKAGRIKSFRGGSFSATIVAIDIGAVVSYRLSSDSSKALPKEVNFSQVLAPGLLFGYGIPGVPLVFNFGCQYTPQLRTFENFGNAPLDAYRVSFSLAYDIPFLNIANSTKRAKRIAK